MLRTEVRRGRGARRGVMGMEEDGAGEEEVDLGAVVGDFEEALGGEAMVGAFESSGIFQHYLALVRKEFAWMESLEQ